MTYATAKSKISQTVQDNYEFYLRFHDQLSSKENWYNRDNYPESKEGLSPLEVFDSIDSHGKIAPCNDVDTLLKVLNGKRSINLHIKMWSEGICDGTFFKFEIEESFGPMPDWVWDSLNKQIWKLDPDGRRYEATGFLYLDRLTDPNL